MKARHIAGGVQIKLTPADLRSVADVLGTCKCGKPAQTAKSHKRADGGYDFENQCFDCVEAERALQPARCAHPAGCLCAPAAGSKYCAPCATLLADHDCTQHAVPYRTRNSHGWECGKCKRFLQAG